MSGGGKKDFDLLAVAAAFAKHKGVPLNDPAFVEVFLADAAQRLKDVLSDNPLLYGTRTERLFEATVLSLGQYRLLKAEDNGRAHADDKLREVFGGKKTVSMFEMTKLVSKHLK